MSVDIGSLNASVMEIVTDFSDEYEATEAVDHAARCASLKPGTPVPAKGGIKLTDNIHHIQNYSFEAEEKIASLCEGKRASVKATMTDAPSEEAVRMMQAINLRDSVSKTELDALASKYGNNYQVRRFIADQLSRRELAVPDEDECDRDLRLIDHAERVGRESVTRSAVERSAFNKAARLSIVRQNLEGTGLFAL